MNYQKAFIFDQRVDCLNTNQLLTVLNKLLAKKNDKKKTMVFALNIHNLIEVVKDEKLKQKYNQADYIIADGVPLLWLSKIFIQPLKERISGTDLALKLLNDSQIKVFMIGGNQQIFDNINAITSSGICDFFSPPFEKVWSEKTNKDIITKINSSGANLVMVAVGAPKQEKWLIDNLHRTNATVGIGVGSALEIIAGLKPRAPKFIRDSGFEWIWRLMLEPKRLWKRYVGDFFIVIKMLAHHLVRDQRVRVNK